MFAPLIFFFFFFFADIFRHFFPLRLISISRFIAADISPLLLIFIFASMPLIIFFSSRFRFI